MILLFIWNKWVISIIYKSIVNIYLKKMNFKFNYIKINTEIYVNPELILPWSLNFIVNIRATL